MADVEKSAPDQPQNCHAWVQVRCADGKIRSFPADQKTQERWESCRQLILAKMAERAEKQPKRASAKSGPKWVIRGEPDLFDVPAWRQRLKELESDDPSDYRDFLIEYTKGHLEVIEGVPASPPDKAEN